MKPYFWNPSTILLAKRDQQFSFNLKRIRKLAILSYQYFPYKGGPTTYVFNLLKEFETDFETYILTPNAHRDIKVINLKGKRGIQLFITTLLELIKLKPKIIHVHEHKYMLMSALLYKKLFSFHIQQS